MNLTGSPEISLAAGGDLVQVRGLLGASALPVDGLEALVGSLLVARVGSRVVGCAALESYPPAALLRSVAVHSDRRGSGCGERLTEAALDLARERGLERVFLLTESAEGFFARFGFRAIDRAEVDEAVQQSPEFAVLCPSSATAMALVL